MTGDPDDDDATLIMLIMRTLNYCYDYYENNYIIFATIRMMKTL